MEVFLPRKKLDEKLRELFLPWLLLAALIGLTAVLVNFVSSPERGVTTATVNFGFEGIESGLDPAGNRFDVSGMKSKEVVRSAMESIGFSAETDEIETVRSLIRIRGYVPEGTLERIVNYESSFGSDSVDSTSEIRMDRYVPTSYSVSFAYRDAGYSKQQGIDFLSALLSSYRDAFYSQYLYDGTIEKSIQSIDYSDYDYTESVEVLDNSLLSLRTYLQDLADQDYTRFRSDETGYSFADLGAAIDTLRSEDVSWLSSYIENYNITKDKAELIDSYNYRIEDAERTKTMQQSRMDTLNAMIEDYEKTNAVVFGLAEGNGGGSYQFTQPSELYDSLISQKVAIQTAISEIQERINRYTTRIERLESSEAVGDVNLAEERLKLLDDKIKRILSDTGTTVREYLETVKMKHAITVVKQNSNASGVTAGQSLKQLAVRSVKDALAFEALLFGLYVLLAVWCSLRNRSFVMRRRSHRKTAKR